MSNTSTTVPRFDKLKVGGWSAFETNMSALLRSRGLMGHVTGMRKAPIVPPANSDNGDLVALLNSKLDDFQAAKEKAAGEIMLWLEPEEQAHVRAVAADPQAMWELLKKRHVQERPTARFNAYDDFFSIRLEEGETLSHLAQRVKDGMRLVVERRPVDFKLEDLDSELQVMAVIRALSGNESCITLVTSLMHASDLSNLDKLEDKLVTEDMQRQKNPGLYGLEKGTEGVLLAVGTTAERANAAAAAAPKSKRSGRGPGASGSSGSASGSSGGPGSAAPASTGSGNSGNPVCTWCKSHGRSGKGHSVDSCFTKRLADMEALIRSGNAGNAAVSSGSPASASFAASGEFAGATTAASSSSSPPTLPDLADDAWNADTGATAHMTPHRHWFASYTPFVTPVRLANGVVIYSAGVGTVIFEPEGEGVDGQPIELSRVLHVPQLCANLLSVLYLSLHKRFAILIHADRLHFAQDGAVLFTARITAGCAAFLEGTTRVAPSAFASMASALRATLPQDLSLWHRRTMHHNVGGLKRVIRDDLATGLSLDSTAAPDPVCEPCLAGKMHARSFPSTGTVTTRILELVHGDLVEMPVRTAQGFRYFVGFHDDASSFHRVYLLRKKSEAFDAFMEFKAWAELVTGERIRVLQEDKGGEFVGKKWDAMYARTGIRARETTRKRPEQNGVAERANRTVVEGTCAVLAESGLAHSFWGEALLSFVDVWSTLR